MRRKNILSVLLAISMIFGIFTSIAYGQEVATNIKVNPSSITIQKGMTQQFTAQLKGKYVPHSDLIWHVDSKQGNTSIDATGLLTVSEEEPEGTLIVTATSREHSHQFGTAIVNVIQKGIMLYNLTVINGTGSGQYEVNAQVPISAIVPSGKEFDHWEGTNSMITNMNAPDTTVTIGRGDATVIAYFRDVALLPDIFLID